VDGLLVFVGEAGGGVVGKRGRHGDAVELGELLARGEGVGVGRLGRGLGLGLSLGLGLGEVELSALDMF